MPSFGRALLAAVMALTVLAIVMATGAYFGAVTAPSVHAVTQVTAAIPAHADALQIRDLAAQEDMAKWAFWMLAISAIGIAITAIGTSLLLWQIILTRKAVADTALATAAMNRQNELAEDAQRPWIALDVEFDFLTSSINGLCLSITAKLSNIGKMPAYRANIEHYCNVEGGNPVEDFRIAAEMPRDEAAIYQSKLIILPGGEAKDQVLIFLDKNDTRLPHDNYVFPQFMVTVFYQLPDGREAQTSAWFSISRPHPDFADGGPFLWDLEGNEPEPIIEPRGYVRVS